MLGNPPITVVAILAPLCWGRCHPVIESTNATVDPERSHPVVEPSKATVDPEGSHPVVEPSHALVHLERPHPVIEPPHDLVIFHRGRAGRAGMPAPWETKAGSWLAAYATAGLMRFSVHASTVGPVIELSYRIGNSAYDLSSSLTTELEESA